MYIDNAAYKYHYHLTLHLNISLEEQLLMAGNKRFQSIGAITAKCCLLQYCNKLLYVASVFQMNVDALEDGTLVREELCNIFWDLAV